MNNMKRHTLKLTARDLLFFRDARPVNGSSIGQGGSWPLPGTLNSAVAAAMHTIDEETAQWEGIHRHIRDKEKTKIRATTFRLGGLKTMGPFPFKEGELFFPTPADLIPKDNQAGVAYLKPVQFASGLISNLPAPLKYGVASSEPPTKNTVGPWISASELRKYLNGNSNVKTVGSTEFFEMEARTGIGIDPTTGTAAKHQFYEAEYMRMNADTSMLMQVECLGKQYGGGNAKDLAAFAIEKGIFKGFQLGGQRGVVYGESTSETIKVPDFVCNGTNVKWTLLSHAIFCNGWLPNFVDKNDGRIYLREEVERGEGHRNEWRKAKQQNEPIKAKLVAARIARAIPVSGWRIDEAHAGGRPKATRMLVPAGSVFYFQCATHEEARKLCTVLHGKCKSDDSDHGYGLGVCSSWDLTTF